MRLIGNHFVPGMFDDLEVTFWLGPDDSLHPEQTDLAPTDILERDLPLGPYLMEVSA